MSGLALSTFGNSKLHPEDREEAVQYCHQETLKSRNHEFQYRIQRADGKYIWMRDVVTVVTQNQKPYKLRGFMLDISRQKKLEEELSEAYKLAKIGNWHLNLEEESLTWSEVVNSIHEVESDFKPDLENALQFYEEGESRDNITRAVERAINHGEAFDLECTIIDANNHKKWVRAVGQSRLKDGNCISIYGTTQDITERKTAEIAEKENRKRLENIMDESMDIICIVDPDGRFEKVSAASEEIWGYTPEELEGTKFIQYVHPDDLEKTKQNAGDLLNGAKTNNFENRYIHKDGTVVPVIWNARWNPDDNKIYGIARDGRELKAAYKKLADTEQHLKNIIEHSTNLFYEHDANGVLTYLSPQSEQFLGYPPEKAKRHWADFITDHPDNKIGESRTLQAIESGESQPPYELQMKKGTGEIIWVEVNEAPVVQNGRTVAVVGALTDITDRKVYEKKLQELSLVASKTTDIVIITDADERITWANRAFEELTEYSFEEAKGKKPGELLQGPRSDSNTRKMLRDAINKKEPVDAVILNYSKSGQPYWLEMHIDPIFDESGNHTHFISIERDVTEKIERENQLRESLERFEIVSKATSDTIWDMNLTSGRILFNDNIYQMFGYEPDDVNPSFEWWKSKLHPDDRPLVNQEIRTVIAEGTERFQQEYRFQAADGSYKHIFDRAFLIKDESGEPIRMIGAMQDNTTEVEEQQELELRESVITNANDTVVITKAKPENAVGREIIYVNDAFLRLTGYEKEEVLGQTMELLNGPDTNRNELERIGKCLDNWEACETEFLNYRKDGSSFWIHVSLVPVKDKIGDYTHWIIIGRDISDYKKHEQELLESLKEKETLLAEIHHRVKNNLAIVSSLMQLQALSTDNADLRTKLFESVLRIKSMANIHEQLYKSHSFSKLQLSKNIRELIDTIVETMAPEKDIQLEFDLDSTEININQGVPTSLIVNEVLTNIVKHAFNGREKGHISISLVENDHQICLQIEDDGIGLPENFGEMKKVSLGLELIDVLTQQIEGENEFVTQQGTTTFRLQFEKKELKGAGSGFVN
jgi:PAS domain S-box-containing protein